MCKTDYVILFIDKLTDAFFRPLDLAPCSVKVNSTSPVLASTSWIAGTYLTGFILAKSLLMCCPLNMSSSIISCSILASLQKLVIDLAG